MSAALQHDGFAEWRGSLPLDLAVALRERALDTRFQPIVDLRTGDTLGWELLTRPLAGMTSIERLFEQARVHGVVWELEAVCRRLSLVAISRLPAALRTRTFFLNVSPAVVADPRFVTSFIGPEREVAGLAGVRVVLELTEQERPSDGSLSTSLSALRDAAVEVALDDFGTGSSGFSALASVQPRWLKLDKGLVRSVQDSRYRQRLIAALVSFANDTGSLVVGEGVEAIEELAVLEELGVHAAQGYLLGRPDRMPAFGVR